MSSKGSSEVTEYGAVYSSASSNPTIQDNKVVTGTTLTSIPSSFIVNLSNLSGSTLYYVRTYASSSVGTSYGIPLQFSTLDPLPKLSTNGRINYNETTRTVSAFGSVDYGAIEVRCTH